MTVKPIVPALAVMALTCVAVAAARQQTAPLQGVPSVVDVGTFAPLATRIDPFVAKTAGHRADRHRQ